MIVLIYISKVRLKDDIIEGYYPYTIENIKNLKEMSFTKPITFFVGENGTGKSTLLEAIAVASGLNAEGGSWNFNFQTKATHSILYRDIILEKKDRAHTKYFLRAESFYNVASELDRMKEEDFNYDAWFAHGGKSLHKQSHGESFIALVENRFYPKGLYFLDEPEAALSPLKQMQLLILLQQLVEDDCQFIIATHSHILLASPNATIYDFDHGLEEITYEETSHYQLYKTFLTDPKRMIERLLEENDEDTSQNEK